MTPSERIPTSRERADAERALAQLEEAYELTVAALAAALELRDDETGSHARRVTELAHELARAVDPALSADRELRYGFLLHDIGKIGIPDAILLKPGSLTPAEQEQLHLHPVLGEQLVAALPHLQGVAREVIAYHHERWDGSGYPWGLRGTQIPLPARIFAVADAFDAITSDRPYKPALPAEAALAEIERQAGRQFDPAVVDALLTLMRRRSPASVAWEGRDPAGSAPFTDGSRLAASATQPARGVDGRARLAMPEEGIEPTRPRGHRILSPARLPVPPLRLTRS
jgi:HD-GYP domain-containing protein (c-di-GMP phosphodiesterase class II)